MRTSVEMFAGGGGMMLGIGSAGFRHLAANEFDAEACKTLRARYGDELVIEGDCREIDWSGWSGRVSLLAGGPPCQPFSAGGVGAAHSDARDMFPEAARAVAEIRPDAFLFENVRGLLRPAFAEYFAYILRRLASPETPIRRDEPWDEHSARLSTATPSYRVGWRPVDVADYGIPQNRRRVLFLGYRVDLGLEPSLPEPTHSADELRRALHDGEYWDEHGLARRETPLPASTVRRLRAPSDSLRWRTLRDAISDLPTPIVGVEAAGVDSHVGVAGARVYPGHSGSSLDWPSKSIKAGVHGVPGGEHIVVGDDGTVRYMTTRECARVQGFPDDHRFSGSRSRAIRQIGNAVPPPLAAVVARRIHDELDRVGA